MKKIVARFGLICLTFCIVLFSLNFCVRKPVHFMSGDLSEGLLQIDYVNVVTGEAGIVEEIEVYRTLTAEEQERILLEFDKIEFTAAVGMEMPVISGEALVLCYSTYKLYVTSRAIEKEFIDSYENDNREQLIYLSYNPEISELIDSIKNGE